MQKSRRLFLLAHPDDEIFALPLLFEPGFENVMLFLATQGCDHRLNEAQEAVQYLQAKGVDVSILPIAFPSSDGLLHLDFLTERLDQLVKLVTRINPNQILTTCYEGGHQDHDTTAVLGYVISRELKTSFGMFTAYRNSKRVFPHFQVLSRINNAQAINFSSVLLTIVSLNLMRIYRSQWRTWMGLGPFIVWNFLKGSCESISFESDLLDSRLIDPFYARRRRENFARVIQCHEQILSFHYEGEAS